MGRKFSALQPTHRSVKFQTDRVILSQFLSSGWRLGDWPLPTCCVRYWQCPRVTSRRTKRSTIMANAGSAPAPSPNFFGAAPKKPHRMRPQAVRVSFATAWPKRSPEARFCVGAPVWGKNPTNPTTPPAATTPNRQKAIPDTQAPLDANRRRCYTPRMSFAYNNLLRHRLPSSLQGTYGELVDQLLLEARAAPTAAELSGDSAIRRTLTRKTIKGHTYWYWQWREGGKTRQKYLGPDGDPATMVRVLAHQAPAAREVMCEVLRPVFGPSLAGPIAKVLKELGAAGLGKTQVAVVGTYAFVAYQGLFAVKWPNFAMTDDLDLAASAVGCTAAINLARVLAKTGLGFQPARHLDTADPPVFYVVPLTHYRVDVLTPLVGRPAVGPLYLPDLESHGAPLRFLDYLLEDLLYVAFPIGTGVLTRVPAPARYALHKLMIAPRRPAADKRQKDEAQAQMLLALLVVDQPLAVRAAWQALVRKPKSWSAVVLEQMRGFPADLRAELAEVLRLEI